MSFGKTWKTWILTLGLGALLAQWSWAQVWTEQLLVSGSTPWRGSPKIWGDKVYYTDQVGVGYNQVYEYNLQTQASTLLLGGGGISRSSSAVWGSNLVVSHFTNGQYDLFVYDGVSESLIASGSGHQKKPDIYQDTVVYEDHSGTYSQVMIWTEAEGSRAIHPASANQERPKIFGDKVVYQESGGVWVWTAETGATRLASGSSPIIYGDKIVYWKPMTNPYPGYYVPGSIVQWTPDGGFVELAPWYDYWGPFEVDMSDRLVAWSLGDPRVAGVYDFTYGERLLNPEVSRKIIGSVFGNSVGWVGSNSYNIYLSTLVPEPSGLIQLALSSAGLLIAFRAKKRK